MRRAILILLLLSLSVLPLSAVGTVTNTNAPANVSGLVSGIRSYVYAWVSDGSGNVNGNTTTIASPGAYLTQVEFVPGTGGAQPDDNYDVTLLDNRGVDLLDGMGINLDQTTATQIFNLATWVNSGAALQLTVSGAGSANGGTVVLWWGGK